MQNYWNIDWRNSRVDRDNKYDYVLSPIIINEHSVYLPLAELVRKTSDSSPEDSVIIGGTDDENSFSIIENEANGYWEIISCDPDTINIVAPNHPLNGKYHILFKKEYFNNRLHFMMYLKNDSTYLICEKDFLLLFGRPKGLDNWEN